MRGGKVRSYSQVKVQIMAPNHTQLKHVSVLPKMYVSESELGTAQKSGIKKEKF